jgi:hypothetical protein
LYKRERLFYPDAFGVQASMGKEVIHVDRQEGNMTSPVKGNVHLPLQVVAPVHNESDRFTNQDDTSAVRLTRRWALRSSAGMLGALALSVMGRPRSAMGQVPEYPVPEDPTKI